MTRHEDRWAVVGLLLYPLGGLSLAAILQGMAQLGAFLAGVTAFAGLVRTLLKERRERLAAKGGPA